MDEDIICSQAFELEPETTMDDSLSDPLPLTPEKVSARPRSSQHALGGLQEYRGYCLGSGTHSTSESVHLLLQNPFPPDSQQAALSGESRWQTAQQPPAEQPFQAEALRADDQQESDEGGARVHLNVGGVLYSTSLGTLCKDQQSMLRALIMDHHRKHGRSTSTTIFIDRDGQRFSHVLNFLRNGTVHLDSIPLLEGLLEEAFYFCIQSLQKLIFEKLRELDEKAAEEAATLERRDKALAEIHLQLDTLLEAMREPGPRIKARRVGTGYGRPVFEMNADF